MKTPFLIITIGCIIIVVITLLQPKTKCDDWWYWENSQQAFNKNEYKYRKLDRDGDKKVCEKQLKQQHG